MELRDRQDPSRAAAVFTFALILLVTIFVIGGARRSAHSRAQSTLANHEDSGETRFEVYRAPIQQKGDPTDTPVAMQNATATAGVGTPLIMRGYNSAIVQISGTWTGTITFKGALDTTAGFVTVPSTSYALSSSAAATQTSNGLYRVQCQGCEQLEAVLSAGATGAVTVEGRNVASGQ